MKVLPSLLSVLLVFLSLSVRAQSEDWKTLNLELTDNYIIPAYSGLTDNVSQLDQQAAAFCAAPSAQSLGDLRSAYHQAMDAWQKIQHIKFGPITYFNWQYRIQYWPDDKGIGGRQLQTLLAAQDTSVLQTDNFARQSVGVQGLPALERLLFDEDALSEFTGSNYRCDVLLAVTDNISEIADGVLVRWQDEFRATVALEDDTGFFEDLQDASTDFVKALVEAVPVVREQKLLEPLGDSFAGQRVRRAESWRSQRSLRNIRLNAQALFGLFQAEESSFAIRQVFAAEDAEVVEAAFAETLALLELMPDSLESQMKTQQGYEQLQSLSASLDALYEALETAVKNTDLYLGFNSLDGD